jgi:hypothetical protein
MSTPRVGVLVGGVLGLFDGLSNLAGRARWPPSGSGGPRTSEPPVRGESIACGTGEEVFELAEPGKPFELYSRTRLKRVK